MTRNISKALSFSGYAVALATAAGTGVVVLGSVAQAEPSGCTSHIVGTTTSSGLLISDMYGDCSTQASRALNNEIREDRNGLPDRSVRKATPAYFTAVSYHSSLPSCDGGKTAVYFGKGSFTVNGTERETPHTRQTTCS